MNIMYFNCMWNSKGHKPFIILYNSEKQEKLKGFKYETLKLQTTIQLKTVINYIKIMNLTNTQ